MSLKTRGIAPILSAVFAAIILACGLASAETAITVGVSKSYPIAVDAGQAIAVADPTIADVQPVNKSEYIIIGKREGETDILVYDKVGRATYHVKVLSPEDYAKTEDIKRAIANPRVEVLVVRGVVKLTGSVDAVKDSEKAERIAKAFSDKVFNFIESPLAPLSEGMGPDAIVALIMGADGVKATMVDKVLILEGKVASQAVKDKADLIAKAFAEKVVNIIEVVPAPAEKGVEPTVIRIYRGSSTETVNMDQPAGK